MQLLLLVSALAYEPAVTPKERMERYFDLHRDDVEKGQRAIEKMEAKNIAVHKLLDKIREKADDRAKERYQQDEDDDSSFLEKSTNAEEPGTLGNPQEMFPPSKSAGPSNPTQDLQPVGPETALVAQEFRDMKELNHELLEKDEEVDKKIAALPKTPEEWGRPRASASDPAAPSSLLEEPDPWDTDDADPQENKFAEGFRELHDNIEGTVRALKQSADMKLESLRADEARVVNRHNVREDEPLSNDGLKQDPLQVFRHAGDMKAPRLEMPEVGHKLDFDQNDPFGSTEGTKSSWLELGNADDEGSSHLPNLRNTNM